MAQVTAKVTDAMRAFFDEMREELGAGNDGAVISHLVKAYQTKESKQAAPKSSDEVFYVKINPRDKELVKAMRDELYDKHSYQDAGILRHFAKMHQALEAGVVYLVKPPKNINVMIQEKAQPLIDDGEVADMNQFLVNELKGALKPKKKSTW